jgi:hypothetical protein
MPGYKATSGLASNGSEGDMAADWYYTTNTQKMGPVSWDELRQLASAGLLKPHDLVWSSGMGDWVKAVRQTGLFTEARDSTAIAATPPPLEEPHLSETRKRIDAELDDIDQDERRQRRRVKERGAEGRKFGIILGGIFLVVVILGCGATGIAALILSGGFGGRTAPANYRVSLAPRTQNIERFRFEAGQQVTIQVRTDHIPNTKQDVDLYVLRGEAEIAKDIRVSPDCDVTFVAPATDTYRVRVVNLGPDHAHSQVSVR